ncbi:hypothetical protein [Elizabethkingia miricola]|uniref:hypothetical protein n=1 Tax=Elizabethkingia miricola TaxID=172045 RepID=UPI002ACEFCCD|nr:hypothetical protein [Elizabethkingia miricola]WQM39434.1 hypothetical protein U2S95_04045 [Elizabethkingia miricola]
MKYDIKAEVIINNLQENYAITSEQYIIQKEGQFSRTYRFDILDAQLTESTQIVSLNLSRDSIYDVLPEGISHAPKKDSSGKDVDVMIKECHEQKKHGKLARLFFQPFENEFFQYGVAIENFESTFLSGLNDSIVPNIFRNFWNMSSSLPHSLVAKFIRLLPYSYKIVGNISLATHILSVLLDEHIEVSDRNYHKYTDESQAILLGNMCLGLDSISGTCYNDYSQHLDIKIGPLKSSLIDFISEGNKKKIIEMYYEYFFPIEVEVNTIIMLSEDKQKFKFNDTEASFLGYNTSI